jgi:hypothetical protein
MAAEFDRSKPHVNVGNVAVLGDKVKENTYTVKEISQDKMSFINDISLPFQF